MLPAPPAGTRKLSSSKPRRPGRTPQRDSLPTATPMPAASASSPPVLAKGCTLKVRVCLPRSEKGSVDGWKLLADPGAVGDEWHRAISRLTLVDRNQGIARQLGQRRVCPPSNHERG